VESFGRTEEIFHEALRHAGAQRRAYVRAACAGDAELEREVLSLLASHDDNPSGESWAAEAAARLIGAPSLEPGHLLGPYRIERFIAAGGMGDVYRATDTRLQRQVAIKLSRATFGERFGREASIIASLNHPHICQVYDVGPNYLVMELVDGSPLRGPLPLHACVEYARQILDALGAAHRKGILHRDLKPSNILVTKHGIKLLDFGLAGQSGAPQIADAPLRTGQTATGEVFGTLRYMSPEQLRGKELTPSSDLFGFGCVLYEMIGGSPAFDAESPASVIAAILEREPPALNVSPGLQRVIQTCLAKDPERRFQDALDAKLALTWAIEPSPASAPRRPWWTAAAALMVLIAIGAGWAVSRVAKPAADNRIVRFEIPLPGGGSLNGGPFGGIAVSPDGQSIAFAADANGQSGLWIRALDADTARLLPGTEHASDPFWSADGRSIAFSEQGTLKQIELSRQRLSRICDVHAFNGGAWLDDGRILFANRNQGIFQVSATGGVPTPVALIDSGRGDVTYADPQPFPGGYLLYTVQSRQSVDIYAAPLANPAHRTLLIKNGRNASVARVDGADYLVWISGDTLMAQPIDVETLRLPGTPRALADHITRASSGGSTMLFGTSLAARQFEWVDRSGNAIATVGPPNAFAFDRLSPDGRRVATIRAGANADIWVLDTERDAANRLTTGRGVHVGPVWSPNGRTLLFSFGAPFNIFRMDAEGAGAEQRVTESPRSQFIDDWSHDGRYVIYEQVADQTGDDLWTLEVTPDGTAARGASPKPYLLAPFDQSSARFSPDDRFVAYESNDSGQTEVYVQAFPDRRDKFPISIGGGTFPEWSQDGRELYYVSSDRKLMAVPISVGASGLKASSPRELFPVTATIAGAPFAAAPDGRRFLIMVARSTPQPLNAIVNWPALLTQPIASQ